MSWWGPVQSLSLPPEMLTHGYWALTRYDDIRQVSRDHETFRSGEGVMFFEAPPEMFEATLSFIAMDAPRHTKLRGLVSSAFTPRQIARLEERIAVHARNAVTEFLEHDEGDFVQLLAKQVPMRMIGEMIGVQGGEEERLQLAAEALVNSGDAEFFGDEDPLVDGRRRRIAAITEIATELAEERARNPADDLMSALVHAEVDGERLTHAGDRRVLQPARGRRQRHDAPLDEPRREGARRQPRPARLAARGPRRPPARRGRGVRALGEPGLDVPPDRDARHRGRRAAGRRGRARRHVLRLGQPRRDRLRRSRTASTSAARPTTTSASAAAACTTASARRWRARNYAASSASS